jgi:hypothetical protein
MNLFQKYYKLTLKEKITLGEAIILLVFTKMIVIFLPIRCYSFLLGKQQSETSELVGDVYQYKIYKISQAIVRSRKIIPWKSKCLTEAIAAKIMLQRRNIESTLYLGVNKNGDKMVAHAWLRCGTIYVTGRRGMHKFVVLSSFA